MRIPCEVVFSRFKANSRQAPVPSKPKKGFVVLQRLRQTPPQYQTTIAVEGDKTGNKFDLNKPPIILDNFIRQGKITLTFQTTPAVMVCINKACPEALGQLIDCIKKISKGENVDIEKVKVKRSDFKPSTITVTIQQDYRNQMKACSDFLKTLKIEPIDLRMPDRKWIECRNITTLILNENPIGSRNSNLDVFSKLKQLQSLELKNCSLGKLPIPALCDMVKGLPITLTSIDLSENQIKVFPPLFHLIQLRSINVSFNNIRYLPSRIGAFQNLNHINLSQNSMTSLPYIFPKIPTIQHVGLNANDELVRLQEEVGLLLVRKITTKVDGNDYTHDGGVDTLMTIASNAIHRDINRNMMIASRNFWPLSVRFQMDDLMYEKPGVSALEMCTNCLRLRHIRV
uniref:Leucine-rich repeat protein 1 n=1 Tax=Caenorhabditis tropicalis TaxID=1561998 RepID=A0A1I7TS48_9PELO